MLSGVSTSSFVMYHAIISVFDTVAPFTRRTFPRYNHLHANSFAPFVSRVISLSRLYDVKKKGEKITLRR